VQAKKKTINPIQKKQNHSNKELTTKSFCVHKYDHVCLGAGFIMYEELVRIGQCIILIFE